MIQQRSVNKWLHRFKYLNIFGLLKDLIFENCFEQTGLSRHRCALPSEYWTTWNWEFIFRFIPLSFLAACQTLSVLHRRDPEMHAVLSLFDQVKYINSRISKLSDGVSMLKPLLLFFDSKVCTIVLIVNCLLISTYDMPTGITTTR